MGEGKRIWRLSFVPPVPLRYYQNSKYDEPGTTRLMASHFVKITDTRSLDEIAARSKEQPVVLFKHSLTCPISAAAYDEMSAFDGEVNLIEVQRNRELSREIENRLGVVHESPQIIVLWRGQVVWNASHFRITAAAVAQALKTECRQPAVTQELHD